MDEIQALRRDIRMLKRALVVAGVAIVALGAMQVIGRSPSELTIGQVSIAEDGITIRGDENAQIMRLRANQLMVYEEGKGGMGGVVLMPGYLLVEDYRHIHKIRMLTSSDEDGGGLASLEIMNNNTGSRIDLASGRNDASAGIQTPLGQRFEFVSEPPKSPPAP